MDHDDGHLSRKKKIGMFVVVVFFSLSIMLTFTSSNLIVFSSPSFRILPVKQENTKNRSYADGCHAKSHTEVEVNNPEKDKKKKKRSKVYRRGRLLSIFNRIADLLVGKCIQPYKYIRLNSLQRNCLGRLHII